jgi:hypothetical protein
MTRIPEQEIARLRSSGLFVSEPLPPKHVFPDGVLIGKPIGIPGNNIPGYHSSYSSRIDFEIEFDAPTVRLYSHHDIWVTECMDFTPGPGPGDFIDEWTTVTEAVDDVLAFYFGETSRMSAKAEAQKRYLKAGQ